MATGTIKKGRKLLWSNQNNSLAANTKITLSSSDYSFLIVEFRLTWQDPIETNIFPKGINVRLFLANLSQSQLSDCLIAGRDLARTSDTEFTASTGVLARLTGAINTGDSFVYPVAIYGID